MSTFNLVSEPWIKVNLINGKHGQFSLRDVFAKAKQIRSIECDNPMQTAAVTRLVLAVMYRAMTPLFESQKNHMKNADVHLWKMLWDDNNATISDSVNTYLSVWESRFDLFDKKRPFYQIANLEYSSITTGAVSEAKRSLSKIMPDGELISVFRNSAFNVAVDYAEAARILITYHSWSTLAPLSPVIGIFPEDDLAVARVYPKRQRGWLSSIGVTLLNGRNLYESLLLNFIPSHLKSKDIPFWEERYSRKVPVLYEKDKETQKPILKQRNAKPQGQVQLFVWFAKSVRLIESEGQVVSVVASEHDSLSARSSQVYMARQNETQTAWRETSDGEMAAYHFAGDSIWQNVPALIPKTTDGFLAPLNVQWAAKISNLLKLVVPARIRIIGASTDSRAQTFRGVIDKTISVTSLSKLDDPSVNAHLESTALQAIKMVRSNYYGFARDSLMATYGVVIPEQLDSMMLPANNALDKAFMKIFGSITDKEYKNLIEGHLTELAETLAELSHTLAEASGANELLGVWRTTEGEKKIYSIAASRTRLLNSLSAYNTIPALDITQAVQLVHWAIDKKYIGLPTHSDIERYVLNFWTQRKTLVDGRPSHIKNKNNYGFFSDMRNSSGYVFDERVSAIIDAGDGNELKESLRRLAGVATSKGIPIDFGTLAAMGSVLSEQGNRVSVAQALLENISEV